MQWNDHWKLVGQHAYLGASKHHWINYSIEKLRTHFANHLKAKEGDELHELAKILIQKRIKQIRNGKTFNTYVNDAIGFFMTPEQPLMYDEDFFGTPDAISYRDHTLRIHDLKTGHFPGHMNQLKIYAALFFLEYGKPLRVKPHDVEIILRIYQNDEIIQEIADPDEILTIMEWGKTAAKEVKKLKEMLV